MTALLDLFCGAGGAAVGFHRAGFDYIFGVDHEWQGNYPFDFVQADALEILEMLVRSGNIERFDVVHASPPCQRFSVASVASGTNGKHPDLIGETRRLLVRSGVPYVIENVPGAPLENPLILCGTMFAETKVRRHRLFETSPALWWPPMACNHNYGRIPRAGRGANEHGYMSIAGNISDVESARAAMQIDWMTRDELSQAIPPAYTEWLGTQLLERLR